MNILIINGSPRKKGLISQMLGIMQKEAVKRGDTVEMVYTNDLTVKPCTLFTLPFTVRFSTFTMFCEAVETERVMN